MQKQEELFCMMAGIFPAQLHRFKIANSLGAADAVLDEYFITDSNGETYKLYKTNEGNWYDIAEANEGLIRVFCWG